MNRRQFLQMSAVGVGGSALYATPGRGQQTNGTSDGDSTTQKDSDGDGIPDSQDAQPQVPATPLGESATGSDTNATTTSSGSGPGFGPLAAVTGIVGSFGYRYKKRETDR